MENITDRVSNPFGMRPKCPSSCDGSVDAVFGYGDANGDFHVVGDHPGIHGGERTGVPFTGSKSGLSIQNMLFETGFAADPYTDEPDLSNCFLSYLHLCCPPNGVDPPASEYDRLERYFDAELRAINAHILLPVGARATAHVLEAYTTRAHKVTIDMDVLHAQDIRGRGVLVVPIKDPIEWVDGDEDAIGTKLDSIRRSDYRQTKGVATTIG